MTRICVVIAVLGLATFGCESRPQNPAATLAGASAQTIMLLPLNVAMTLPPEIEGPSGRVWEALEDYLADHGKKLRTLRFGDARRLWLNCIRQAKAGERASEVNFDTIAQILALELGQHAEFDAVIIPSLFIQQARLQGKSASWDRVVRRVEIYGDVRRIGSIVTSTSLHGATPGASLHVAILDANGEKLMEAQAGLELLEWMTVTGEAGAPTRERDVVWAPRPDLFANEVDLREGIEKVLDPFLPPLSESN